MSRRARVLLAVLIVSALTLLILDLRGGQGPLGSARSAGSGVLGAVERGAATVFSPFFALRDWWGTLLSQSERITDLEAQNAQLRTEVERNAADRARANAVDALLGIAGVGQYRIVPAEVIAIGPAQDFSWTVTIDAGRRDGIERDMSVINGEGLVGRVESVARNTATVVLIVDASSAIGARIAQTDEVGILSGVGRQDSLDFQLLDPLAKLDVGNALITFGSRQGRPYAPGLPIGEVVDISGSAGQLNRIATVRPFVNVSTLSIVGVVTRPPRSDPRDSVLLRLARPAAPVDVQELVEEVTEPDLLEADVVP